MAVHMFRCFVGRGSMSITDLETRINDWIESNGEWEGDVNPHILEEASTDSGETYYWLNVRFLPEQSKDNLQIKFSDKLDNKVSWYRVWYHSCKNRANDGSDGNCSWDSSVEWTAKDVSIPAGVPEMVA